MPDIYPLREFEGISLAIMPRPRAGEWLEDEVTSWHREGIRTVVSLLEVPEIAELGLLEEPRLCASQGIEFISFPIPDRGVPTSYGALNQIADTVLPKVRAGSAGSLSVSQGEGR